MQTVAVRMVKCGIIGAAPFTPPDRTGGSNVQSGHGPPFKTVLLAVDTLGEDNCLTCLGECRGPMTRAAVETLLEMDGVTGPHLFAFIWDANTYTLGIDLDDWQYPFTDDTTRLLATYKFPLAKVVELLRLETGLTLTEPK